MKKSYSFDVEAIVYPSQFNPAPRRNPVEAVEIAADFQARPGFDRDRYCLMCEQWDKPLSRNGSNSRRPPGTMEREACNGCVLSFLDEDTERTRAVRDRLFTDYAEARSNLQEHEMQKLQAQSATDKNAWRLRHATLKRDLERAAGACNLAGFDPSRWKRRRKKQGELAEGQGPGRFHQA